MNTLTPDHQRKTRLGSAVAAAFVAIGLGTAVASAQDSSKEAPVVQAKLETGIPAARAANQTKADGNGPSAASPSDPQAPTYLRDVLPVFMGKCARCHNDQSRLMYDWMNYKTAFADRWAIKRRVWDSWKGQYYKQSMPAGNGPECEAMTAAERKTIKDWVATGAAYGVPPVVSNARSKAERIEQGSRLFASICALCHQPTGLGIPNQFPPLASSDFLNANKERAIKILLHGRQGAITVNGHAFDASMPSLPLGDEDIANALTYVYNSFGNSGKEVTPEEVRAARAEKEDVTQPSTQKEVAKAPRVQNPYE